MSSGELGVEERERFSDITKQYFISPTLNGDGKTSLKLSESYCAGLIDQFFVIDRLLQRDVHG